MTLSQLDKYFIFKCQKGLKQRGLSDKQEYIDRLQFEIDTIVRMKFPGYFLIVADFIKWAKQQGILVGAGRGSIGGSLIAYCLKITEIDPIKWDLLFERFMNPDRVSMPDCDSDFEINRRHEVVDYVTQKYGMDCVAHIGTFGTIKAKSAVRDACRVLGEPIILGDKLSKMLLAPISGKPQPLKESFVQVPELQKIRDSEVQGGTVLRWAEKIEGLKKSQGVHAAGVVISNDTLLDKVPLFASRHKEVTTQWEMNNLEETGFIKFDFLGVEALDKMSTCLKIIKERYGKTIDINNIPLDDDKVFETLRSGSTVGVFQMEGSAGIRDLLVRVKPICVEDIVATTCLYRPGPISAGYTDIYVDVKNGVQEPRYIVPELKEILGETHSVFVYQEQVMNIAKKLCGYTGGMADELRKAIGKKIQSLMDKHESLFKDGWIKNGYPKAGADELWTAVNACASYLFNKSHGVAYSIITYQTAYLKTHYPTEYMCAVMLCIGKKKKDHLIRCLTECKRLGIKVLPPDINDSQNTFSVTGDKEIRFGLGPIKNVGAGANAIMEERKFAGKFTSFRNFCERMETGSINRQQIECLIKAGCFDRFGPNRATMLNMVEKVWEYRSEMKKYIKKMETYEKNEEKRLERLREIEEGLTKKKPLKPRVEPEEPQWPEMVEMDELSDSDIHTVEHELLGFFVSSHPLDKFNPKDLLGDFTTIDDMQDMGNEQQVTFAGVITNLKEITTKNSKKKMAFPLVEDLTGSVETTVFPAVYNRVGHLLDQKNPVVIRGTTDITETDEGDKTIKVIVKNITLLDLNAQSRTPDKIDVCIPPSRVNDLLKLLDKYAGDVHEVKVAVKLLDGTKIKFPVRPFIGNHKEVFTREINRLKDGV